MQFAGEPADRIRPQGIRRNDFALDGITLGTFEQAMFEADGIRTNARKHHARRAVQTA
jgi:hypothetical protein